MTETSNQNGKFSWCELLTTDTESSKAFYGKLFNWELEPAPNAPPGVDYTIAKCNGQPIAGMMALPDDAQGVPPHWGSYITVADVNASVKFAVELGGTVLVPPQDIPLVGSFSVIQDPQGAVFGIISYLPEHCA